MNTLIPDSLRVQVDLVDNQPRVTIDGSPPKKKKRKTRKPLVIPRGSISVRIYRTKNGRYRSHTLIYYEGGRRRREVRSSLQEAKDLAEIVLTRLENGEAVAAKLGPEETASCLRALRLAASIGKPLELAMAERVDWDKKLKELGAEASEVFKFFAENRPKDCKALPLSKLIETFLSDKKAEIGGRWYDSLECHLDRFADHFSKHCSPEQQPAPLHALTSADLNAFLRELNVGGRSRHNYRAAIEQLVRWSKGNGHLPKTWSEMEAVADPGARFDGEIKIFTPEELAKLLCARQQMEELGRAKKSLIPFIVLQAFGGVRHEEIRGEKGLLDWRDIHLEERYVFIHKGLDKTGRGRSCPVSDNLAAWLQPYERSNGEVCPIMNTSHALCDAKQAAGLKAGKNETRNTLRKSFISYRLAVTKNIAQVAEEAGNSAAKIRSNYNRPIPEKEGLRWFNIWPTAADVVQLNFGFR